MNPLTPKVEVRFYDKNRVVKKKGKWDSQRGLIEVKRGFRKGSEVYYADPEHIYIEYYGFGNRKWKLVAHVDNATRETINVNIPKKKVIIEDGKKTETEIMEKIEAKPILKIHSDDEIDQKKRIALSYLTLEAFLKSLWAKQKIPTIQMLVLLFAGAGIYHFLVLLLRACGLTV